MQDKIICETCKKELEKPEKYHAWRSYVDVDEFDWIEENHNFCGFECAKEYGIKNKLKGIRISYSDLVMYSIDRCKGYYNCLNFNNVSEASCERKVQVDALTGNCDIDDLASSMKHKFCEPAMITQVNIVERVANISAQMGRDGRKQDKITRTHTQIIIILTILNILVGATSIALFILK